MAVKYSTRLLHPDLACLSLAKSWADLIWFCFLADRALSLAELGCLVFSTFQESNIFKSCKPVVELQLGHGFLPGSATEELIVLCIFIWVSSSAPPSQPCCNSFALIMRHVNFLPYLSVCKFSKSRKCCRIESKTNWSNLSGLAVVSYYVPVLKVNLEWMDL